MAATLICKVLGHRVDRKRIRRDGETFIGKCRWCRGRMVKVDEGWELRAFVR